MKQFLHNPYNNQRNIELQEDDEHENISEEDESETKHQRNLI